MADSKPTNQTKISLDQLIALNDELVALVRSGVPLEKGLMQLGSDIPGRLGKITQGLAHEMERGEPLDRVLETGSVEFPPVYRAVVEAGTATGRLAEALESVAGAARRLAENRRVVASSAVYPMIVFFLAWGLFVFFVRSLAPAMWWIQRDFHAPLERLYQWIASWGESAYFWGPSVPAAVILLIVFWWWRSNRAGMVSTQSADRLFGWIPGMGRTARLFRSATFAEMLALLIEHEVPMPRAIRLAAEASSDRHMIRASEEIALALERGEAVESTEMTRQLPPLLAWLLTFGARHGTILPALRHAADLYHRRGMRRSEMLRIFFPIAMTVCLGGGLTFLYGLLIYGSWISLIYTIPGIG